MLKLKNIDAFFGKIQGLRHVTLHVEAGEIVSLIGANGAGKTSNGVCALSGGFHCPDHHGHMVQGNGYETDVAVERGNAGVMVRKSERRNQI